MRRFALALFFVFFGTAVLAEPLHFPALTGRVVDDAHILPPEVIQELDQKLAGYESNSSNQIVVVTLSSLQGDSIEDYGYRLGRYWGIGQKGKNNGALLIVAPNERKVRIEVGYGGEGLLTDAASSEVINGIIVPAFKKGNITAGIVQGTDSILYILGYKEAVHVDTSQNSAPSGWSVVFIIIMFGLLIVLGLRYPTFGNILWLIMNIAMSSSSRSSSSGFSSGFSGGGGSFGGGGASGSW